MPSLKVSVTPDDIEEGKPEQPEDCPIALAFSRAWTSLSPLLIEPSVGHETIEVTVLDDEPLKMPDFEIALPPEATAWVKQFDGERFYQCEPFDFTVEVPETVSP